MARSFNFFDANGDPLAGVTVDSSDGCIVNNRFLCGAGPTTVPEPSTWTLMLLGFAGPGYAGWRRGGCSPLAAWALRGEELRRSGGADHGCD